MDIKKTDIFSGIGVFLIQIVANIICYALQKNKVYLFLGIIFAFIISVSIVIIVCLKRKLKQKELEYNEEINTLKRERDEFQQEVIGESYNEIEIMQQIK